MKNVNEGRELSIGLEGENRSTTRPTRFHHFPILRSLNSIHFFIYFFILVVLFNPMLARLPQLGRIAHLRGRGATIPRALQHSKFDRPLYYDEPPALPNRAREHSSTSTSTTSADTSFRSQQHLQQQRHSGKRRSTVEEIMLDGARVVSAAHALFNSIIRAGDVVVDATCGNGHDTLFLAERVGAKVNYVIFSNSI